VGIGYIGGASLLIGVFVIWVDTDTGCHMTITIQDTHFEFQIKFNLKNIPMPVSSNFVGPSDFLTF
jgi:hypothetical protein